MLSHKHHTTALPVVIIGNTSTAWYFPGSGFPIILQLKSRCLEPVGPPDAAATGTSISSDRQVLLLCALCHHVECHQSKLQPKRPFEDGHHFPQALMSHPE